MSYTDYNNIEDFIFDRSFIRWVLSNSHEENGFWQNWEEKNPEKATLLKEAKAFVYALQVNFPNISEEDIDGEIKSVLLKLKGNQTSLGNNLQIRDQADIKKLHSQRWLKITLAFAAAFAVIIFIAYRYYTPVSLLPDQSNAYSLHTQHKVDIIELNNQSDTVQQVFLPDGSLVALAAKSKLSYTQNFSGASREVYLDGEAFFNVTKNPSKPFLVYTAVVTTKVLGTSFSVKAFEAEKNALVSVKTGKVTVFKTTSAKAGSTSENKAIILMPNQQIVYTAKTDGFIKELAEKPAIVSENKVIDFSFHDTPLNKVFTSLEEAYRIPIVYDEETILSCSLSATLGDEPFFEKLSIICKAINASYEVIDGNIVITAKGCK